MKSKNATHIPDCYHADCDEDDYTVHGCNKAPCHECSKPAAMHTPTPWKVDLEIDIWNQMYKETALEIVAGFDSIAYVVGKDEDAAFIVLAVNSHAKMLAALKAVLKTMYANPSENMDIITKCSTTVKDAIAKAEGVK